MNKDQLLDLLREHLTIQVRVNRPYAYDSSTYVKVDILFDGECIAEDYDSLPECAR